MRNLLLIFFIVPLLSCAGAQPADPGIGAGQLAPCPVTPNCVSSDATDALHFVAPLQLAVPAPAAWRAARVVVAGLPRAQIVSETPDALHAQCESALFGFVDDLDLQLRPADGIIAVRSASRIGLSDLGANNRRVETLRAALAQQGIVR
jgi:uncharacterized protein (DUF1499 family)